MGLLSLFQRNAQKPTGKGRGKAASSRPSPDPAAAAENVREARTRARRRLMGATVLLLAGVIGFPLLFETRPRPIPVDLPIEIPSRNGTAPLADAPATRPANRLATAPMPGDEHAATAVPAPAPSAAAPSAAPPMVTETETPAPAPAPVASRPSPVATAAAPHVAASRPSPAASRPTAVAAAPAAPAATPPAASAPAAADAGHFVVQIGAFAEQPKAHDARVKVEKLGLKTYVQVVDTSAGRRIRVRVGPFSTKAEADKAAARIKGDGLPAAVLQL